MKLRLHLEEGNFKVNGDSVDINEDTVIVLGDVDVESLEESLHELSADPEGLDIEFDALTGITKVVPSVSH